MYGADPAGGRRGKVSAMLERSLTYALASIAEDGIGAANDIFVATFGWSVRELRVLRLIRDNPGMTFTALAERTKLDRSFTSRMLTRLMRAGLIERIGSQEDARRYALHATGEGLALCAAADPLTTDFEALMLAPLSADERRLFVGLVERVKAWVQEGYVQEVAARYPQQPQARKRAERNRR
jgi:DNA-binding MarR family transcriptional regulator